MRSREVPASHPAPKADGHHLRPVRPLRLLPGLPLRRIKAVEEHLALREPRTRARPGERPDLSLRFHYQDSLRLRRFSMALSVDVCDLKAEMLTRYLADHFADAAAKSRNHHRGTLSSFLDHCVRAKCLRRNHELMDAPGMIREKARTADTTLFTPAEFRVLLAHVMGEFLPQDLGIPVERLAHRNFDAALHCNWWTRGRRSTPGGLSKRWSSV
ncbi:MAG: hypothetical protein KF791_16450 [Verrucomicrobiae bacterium]|nr:hypothetical protein [Verrucomicrobiae bacterium]